MKLRIVLPALFLAIAILIANVSPALALPPLPSSFYGTVKFNGNNVPAGTIVQAYINGIQYAYAAVIIDEDTGDSVYFFAVPGDDPDTSSVIEGGVQGNTVRFYVNNISAFESGTWATGTNVELNLIENPTAVTLIGVRAYNANQLTPLKVVLFSLMGLMVAGIGVAWLLLNRVRWHKKQVSKG